MKIGVKQNGPGAVFTPSWAANALLHAEARRNVCSIRPPGTNAGDAQEHVRMVGARLIDEKTRRGRTAMSRSN
eukprot:11166587-Lingulodinium_polyedra.AAC.1